MDKSNKKKKKRKMESVIDIALFFDMRNTCAGLHKITYLKEEMEQKISNYKLKKNMQAAIMLELLDTWTGC